jgi:NADPH-dependent curcumin reductase CurA
MRTSREIHLAARPRGEARLTDFQLATVEVPQPAEGQILVRNTWMSVDPYMRGRMDEGESYIPQFEIGAPLEGAAVGEVVASRAAAVPVGATVTHFLGWREYAVIDAAAATVVDTALAPPEAYVGVLGTTGLTAYVAVTELAPVREGDVVFVSSAAGAVGSVAGQLARKLGASRVIGSAGGPSKVARLTGDFGFDTGLDYKARPIGELLAEAAPDGIDVYVDNVGGDHLVAAIDALRHGGRIAMVGAISGYDEPVPGPDNVYDLRRKDGSLRGMLVTTYLDRFPEWIGKAAGWLADGSLRTGETVADGIESAPGAFLDMMRGANVGKMLVRLA